MFSTQQRESVNSSPLTRAHLPQAHTNHTPGAGAAMVIRTAVSTVLTMTRPGRLSLGGQTSLAQRV
jgi:hypothetical protein